MGRGFFIVLEGIDGSGKTTQARLLAEALRHEGYEVVLTREPSDGPLGRWLRRYLAGSPRRLSPELELAWFMADRREHVENLIRPALEHGKIVISDRYYCSSMAYQGALGLDPEEILAVHRDLVIEPDVVILLTLPLGEALARRRGQARQLSEGSAYLKRVAAIYDTLKGETVRRISSLDTPENTHARVMEVVLQALAVCAGKGGRGSWPRNSQPSTCIP